MNFIRTYMMDDSSICDRLINFFEINPNKYVGITVDKYGNAVVNRDYKDSININFEPGSNNELFVEYQHCLQQALMQYVEEFKYCNENAPWTIIEPVTIQKYLPGGGFKAWHTERVSAALPIAARHLVFLTYLNDVTDAGETEFYYQNVKISARKGTTAIWPSDWTYTHRGIPSPTQEKYIMAGWLNYYIPKVV